LAKDVKILVGWIETFWHWRDFVLRLAVNFSISSSPNRNIANTLIPPEFALCDLFFTAQTKTSQAY